MYIYMYYICNTLFGNIYLYVYVWLCGIEVIYVYKHACTWLCVMDTIYVCLYTCIHVWGHVCVHAYTWLYVIDVYVCVYICVCVYIYIYTCTHTHSALSSTISKKKLIWSLLCSSPHYHCHLLIPPLTQSYSFLSKKGQELKEKRRMPCWRGS